MLLYVFRSTNTSETRKDTKMTGPTTSLENSDSGMAEPSGLAGFAYAILVTSKLKWSVAVLVERDLCAVTKEYRLADLVGTMLGSREVDGGYDTGILGMLLVSVMTRRATT